MPTIQTASFSHIGGRDEQQDAVHIFSTEHTLLLVVADGVGGNVGGAAASQAAIAEASNFWKQSNGIFDNPKDDLTTIAKNAHDSIRELAPNERRSPSSTLVMLYLDKETQQAHWVHCGDSRLYRIRNSEIITQTRDHSIVQLLLEQGEITEDERNKHPDKGRILKSLGASKFKGVDYDSCQYEERDAFLLCSDGYWESLEPQMPTLPLKPTSQSLEAYTKQIVSDAVHRNGEDGDNTTVAIAYVAGTNQSDAQDPHTQQRDNLKWKLIPIILILIALLEVVLLLWLQFGPKDSW
jgi:protein phosphatase